MENLRLDLLRASGGPGSGFTENLDAARELSQRIDAMFAVDEDSIS